MSRSVQGAAASGEALRRGVAFVPASECCVIGVDVGTQGARALALALDGRTLAESTEPFHDACVDTVPPRVEQRPESWWQSVTLCLRALARSLAGTRALALAVDSTSGTFLAVDAEGEPLGPAVMYNDARAGKDLANEVQSAGAEVSERLGYRFPPNFALPKMLWLARHHPEILARTRWLLHPADFIVGRLTGRYGVSDIANALKSGYDLERLEWPRFIEDALGIPLHLLPEVHMCGAPIGVLSDKVAGETGLPAGLLIAAGATDGTASLIGSGAAQPGEWNSTLGTTLAIRGVSRELVRDPLGRFYSHRHPDGWWLPGGASNVGGECLAPWLAETDPAELDAVAKTILPTDLVVYPLVRQGERAPFVSDSATGFEVGTPRDEEDSYAARLEAVALVERWCYEELEALGAEVGVVIRTTGGASKSDVWTQLRADILGRMLIRPKVPGAAMGSAILAAAAAAEISVGEAARQCVRSERSFVPSPRLHYFYENKYRRLREECERRGYCAGS